MSDNYVFSLYNKDYNEIKSHEEEISSISRNYC